MYELDRWQARHWEKGSRYYVACLEQSLFGEWQLERRWGGKGRRGGRTLTETAADYAEALKLMETTAIRRRQRGYAEV